MRIAVFKTVQIPHQISIAGLTLYFNPICNDVPDGVGKTILKNKPDIYFEVKEDEAIDVSGYKVKDVFQGKHIEEIFNMLPEKERVEIYNLLRKKAIAAQRREEKETKKQHAVVAESAPNELQKLLNVTKEQVDAEDAKTEKPSEKGKK